MKFLLTTGIILTLTLFLATAGFAAETTDENAEYEKTWAGTWTDVNYSLSIEQNDREITGIAHSFDLDLDDPFLLTGTISDDGESITGVMKDSGTLDMYLSDDQMSFTADGTVDTFDNTTEVYTYKTKAARNSTIIPDSIWSGNWLTGNSSIYITQTDDLVTGEYFPLEFPEGTGVFEGYVLDGKTASIVWMYTEDITFIQSDDGMYLIEADCDEKEIAYRACMNFTKTC